MTATTADELFPRLHDFADPHGRIGWPVATLATVLDLPRTTLTRLLDRLITNGLVIKTPYFLRLAGSSRAESPIGQIRPDDTYIDSKTSSLSPLGVIKSDFHKNKGVFNHIKLLSPEAIAAAAAILRERESPEPGLYAEFLAEKLLAYYAGRAIRNPVQRLEHWARTEEFETGKFLDWKAERLLSRGEQEPDRPAGAYPESPPEPDSESPESASDSQETAPVAVDSGPERAAACPPVIIPRTASGRPGHSLPEHPRPARPLSQHFPEDRQREMLQHAVLNRDKSHLGVWSDYERSPQALEDFQALAEDFRERAMMPAAPEDLAAWVAWLFREIGQREPEPTGWILALAELPFDMVPLAFTRLRGKQKGYWGKSPQPADVLDVEVVRLEMARRKEPVDILQTYLLRLGTVQRKFLRAADAFLASPPNLLALPKG